VLVLILSVHCRLDASHRCLVVNKGCRLSPSTSLRSSWFLLMPASLRCLLLASSCLGVRINCASFAPVFKSDALQLFVLDESDRRIVCSVQYQRYIRNVFTGFVKLDIWLCVEPDDRLALHRNLRSHNEFGPNQCPIRKADGPGASFNWYLSRRMFGSWFLSEA